MQLIQMKEIRVSYTSENMFGNLKFKLLCLRGTTASPCWCCVYIFKCAWLLARVQGVLTLTFMIL
jgi:hypothetical protein